MKEKMIEYTVIYERGETNWGAYIPDLPGCVSIGDTLIEVQENIKEAMAQSARRRRSHCI
ncbi:type II toxin-antitoxin system HicB family antitoxin [Cylindrospermum sp. FACHB-282]|uniref:type II toxin-antitoxin system HicB family antitoxin n=1 Tax=Cylindrospermum sp. FACHB-282 TaxID=2692794 RepID=UPI001F54ADE8|nr:type II toxin-antitoxin system HicB family antitoxin [Cylindrospermum sp. FACHB-282]